MTTTNTRAAELGLLRPDVLDSFNLESIPEHHRERVAALIPSLSIAPTADNSGGYVMREVNGLRDLDFFAVAMSNAFNVLLSGPTGSAKTTAGKAFAAVHGIPFYALPLNGGIDPSGIWGRWVVNGETGNLEWVESPAALVVMYGGVLIQDEVNMVHPRIAAALHDLLDDRRQFTLVEKGGETVKAHPATLFIGTQNPGYAGTATLNAAFARRYAWPVEWQYSPEVETALIPSPTLLKFVEQVRDLPEVRTDLSTATLETFITTCDLVGAVFAAGRLVAGFHESERGGVEKALEMYLPSIVSELGEST